jgi:hypothetical protein
MRLCRRLPGNNSRPHLVWVEIKKEDFMTEIPQRISRGPHVRILSQRILHKSTERLMEADSTTKTCISTRQRQRLEGVPVIIFSLELIPQRFGELRRSSR